MFGFGSGTKRTIRDTAEEKIEDIQLNLENNYRKPAADAYREALRYVNDSFSNGLMDEKYFNKCKKALLEYEIKLQGYL